MHTRHTNRSPRGNLLANRREVDARPQIESFEVPTVKLGRFVNFNGDGVFFAGYLERLRRAEENEKGISKGWFSVVQGQIFVEYADLTASLEEMLVTRVRPRSFRSELRNSVEGIRSDLRGVIAEDAARVDELNVARSEAIQAAITNGDHVDEMMEFSELYEEQESRWGDAFYTPGKQPKITARDGNGQGYEYGFPLEQTYHDQFLRDDLSQIVTQNGLVVPDQLRGGQRPVVPVLKLHRELSAMEGHEPYIPVAPEVQLGPVEIHRF